MSDGTSARPLSVVELFRNRRENAVLWLMTRGRGFRIGYLFFGLLLIGAVAASLAVAVQMMREGERETVGIAGLAVYGTFVPFMLATIIPLSVRRVSIHHKQEIWTTPLTPREIAFGVLYSPLRVALAVTLFYPILFAAFYFYSFRGELTDILLNAAKSDPQGRSAFLAIFFLALLYLYSCAASAQIPLLSRVRSFPIPWSPVLIAPFWALGHIIGTGLVLYTVSLPYTDMLAVIMGPGQGQHSMSSNISLCILATVALSSFWVMWRTVVARAGARWLSDAVPHVAAGIDWSARDRVFRELSEGERLAEWKRFWINGWKWWRSRLKWAAIGLAISMAPMIAGFVLVPWGAEVRTLRWGGLMAMPLLVPAMVFAPSLLWRDASAVPLIRGRLLATSLILFAPCASFCSVGVFLVLLLDEGFALLAWEMIPYGVAMQLLMSTFFVLPSYAVWIALLPQAKREWLLGGIGVLFAAFIPAAMGIWSWWTLPGVVVLSGLLALLICTSLIGSVSLLLQRCFVMAAESAEGEA